MATGREGSRSWLQKLTSFFRRQPHQETSRKQDLGNKEQNSNSPQNEIPKLDRATRQNPHHSQNHGLAGSDHSYAKVRKDVQFANTFADLAHGPPINFLHGPHKNMGIVSGANTTQGWNAYQQLPTASIPPAHAISRDEQTDEIWKCHRESNVNEEDLNEMQMKANDDVEEESDQEDDFPGKMHFLSSSMESLSMTPLSKTASQDEVQKIRKIINQKNKRRPLKSILKSTKRRHRVTFSDETVPFHGEDRQHHVPPATATSSSTSFMRSNLVERNSSFQTLGNMLNDGSYQGEDGSINVEPRTGTDSARPITEEYQYQDTRATPNDDNLITNQNIGITVLIPFVDETNKCSVDAGNENNSQLIEIILHEMGTSASDLENHSAETISNPIFTSNEISQNRLVMQYSRTETTAAGGVASSTLSNGGQNSEQEAYSQQNAEVGKGIQREDVNLPSIPNCSSKFCEMSFKGKGNLKRRIHLHTGKKRYSCGPCGKVFLLKYDFQQHLQTDSHLDKKRDMKRRVSNCTTCGKAFSTKGNLTKHMKIHSGVKAHKCEECERSFFQKTDLKRHSLTHSGDKPYPCDLCEMKFTRKMFLRKHLQTHETERKSSDFLCDTCGKSFATEGTLEMHMRVHTDTAIE